MNQQQTTNSIDRSGRVRNYNFTQADLDDIADRYESGERASVIAKKYGCDSETIRWHMLRLGVLSPAIKRRGLAIIKKSEIRVMRRGNHIVRRFTEEEDRRLLELEASGIPINMICQELNRSRNSINGRLSTLARHQALAEECA
jgi:hypothetical protein